MKVIDHGALTGYISINKAWAGYDADEYYRISSIAMGLEDGELETDLENEHLPEGGKRLAGYSDDNGVQRIARALSQEELEIKEQLEGKDDGGSAQSALPIPKVGYQVVSGNMFHHVFEPAAGFTPNTLSFNTTCVERLDRLEKESGQYVNKRQQYVEILLNPVERMMAVRPCSREEPNAIRWINALEKGTVIGAKAFCSILYKITGWDTGYSYRVPATVRRKGDETVLFFDLDNYIGREIGKRNIQQNETLEPEPEQRVESEETRGIFYGVEDEPQPIRDTEEIERRLRERNEYEKRNFGTPAFEHSSEFRLTAIDDEGEWDVMTCARPLDSDHRVDESEIEALQEGMLESLIASEEEQKGGLK